MIDCEDILSRLHPTGAEDHRGADVTEGEVRALLRQRQALDSLLAALECSPVWLDWSTSPEVEEAFFAIMEFPQPDDLIRAGTHQERQT